jgi:hypothetical protein
MKTYLYLCVIFCLLIFSSCATLNNQQTTSGNPIPAQVGTVLSSGPAQVSPVQAQLSSENGWEEIYINDTGNDKVWIVINQVMKKYFFKMIVDSDGGWVNEKEKETFITEWIQTNPNTLRISAVLTKSPGKLFIKMEGEEFKDDKWVPRSLSIKEQNLFQDIKESLRYKIFQTE